MLWKDMPHPQPILTLYLLPTSIPLATTRVCGITDPQPQTQISKTLGRTNSSLSAVSQVFVMTILSMTNPEDVVQPCSTYPVNHQVLCTPPPSVSSHCHTGSGVPRLPSRDSSQSPL